MAGGTSKRSKGQSLAAVVREARDRHAEKRARRLKQPWAARKFAVGIAVAIIGYSCYVYYGRLCVPMIRRDGSALGGRRMGIAFLVVSVALAFMMIWAYIKVVFTPPGFARDYVAKAGPPNNNASPLVPDDAPTTASNESTIGIPYEATAKPSIETSATQPSSTPAPSSPMPTFPPMTEKSAQGPKPEALESHPPAQLQPKQPNYSHTDGPVKADWERGRLTRSPPSLPVLDPQYRYCRRCSILKPPRSHHCRSCGTCVLKFDHHCPWIGQCVGAQNQKFFFDFLFWACLFCLWTFSTLVGLNAKNDSKPGKNVDPQHIVAIVLSGFFSIFTVAMIVTQASLISTNQTTVEHLASRTMKDRESDMLAEIHSPLDFLAKRRTRRQWDAEWGRIGLEGNLWWQGSIAKHWREVMGENPLTWFLPIGHSTMDGVNFPRNPRFDEQGRWMPKKYWPPELR